MPSEAGIGGLLFTMSGDHNEDVEKLLGHFRRGLLDGSSSSGSGSRRRQRSERAPTSPRTPAGTVRDVLNSDQTATKEIETPPAGAISKNEKVSVFNKLGVGRLGSEVSPGVFYGSPAGKSAHRPPKLIRLLNEIQNDLASQSTPSARAAIWATFPRQDQAVQFADSHGGQNLAVFQYQDHLTGQRRFLTTTYNEFWRRYSKMRSGWKHHYEIIRQALSSLLRFRIRHSC